MKIEQARVIGQKEISGGYRVLAVKTPRIAASVKPGQFIHVLVPRLDSAVLRRPFSVFDANKTVLLVLYKQIGKGTRAMGSLGEGDEVSVMGPLGNGFPRTLRAGVCPVLVAGGYGVAPLCFLASRMKRKGVFFVGGATRRDILCIDRIRSLGWRVGVATEDGSFGRKGLVTDVLDVWLKEKAIPGEPEFFACGPDGMLKAVGARAVKGGWKAWLSLDKHMGCGVGACLACVQRIRGADGRETLVRVCKEGPVFEARAVVWG
jgi:dihydroorotate dehydrogenase electron transfer subunit